MKLILYFLSFKEGTESSQAAAEDIEKPNHTTGSARQLFYCKCDFGFAGDFAFNGGDRFTFPDWPSQPGHFNL